jgi:hypothetical protein
MRNTFIFICLAMLLTASCRKDEAVMTLTFHAQYDGVAVDQAKTYAFGDVDVQLSRFNLFLSDLVLVKADGTELPLSEIEFLDFTPPTDLTSVMDPVAFTFTVPNGDYTSLKMGYGVKPSLNAKKPSQFAAGDVLNVQSGEYWDSWASFIFMKLEGAGQTDPSPDPEVNLVYHCGSDPVYRIGSHPISLNVKGEAKSLDVTFDIKKLFYQDSEWYDIETSPRTSDALGDVKVATILMDRVQAAVIVK